MLIDWTLDETWTYGLKGLGREDLDRTGFEDFDLRDLSDLD